MDIITRHLLHLDVCYFYDRCRYQRRLLAGDYILRYTSLYGKDNAYYLCNGLLSKYLDFKKHHRVIPTGI